jgi:hypothetical protein
MSEPLWKVYEGMLTETREKLSAETKLREEAQAALGKLNEIRNSIIGAQAVNWSEHVYPLVAVLDAAGLPGMPYPEARQNVGTLLSRLAAAEARATRAEGALRELNDALHWNVDPKRGMIGAWFRYRTPYVRLHAKVARALAGEAQKEGTNG